MTLSKKKRPNKTGGVVRSGDHRALKINLQTRASLSIKLMGTSKIKIEKKYKIKDTP